VEAHKEKGKKEVVGVPKATSGQSFGQEHYPFGKH